MIYDKFFILTIIYHYSILKYLLTYYFFITDSFSISTLFFNNLMITFIIHFTFLCNSFFSFKLSFNADSLNCILSRFLFVYEISSKANKIKYYSIAVMPIP